jgi:hypothetical protein
MNKSLGSLALAKKTTSVRMLDFYILCSGNSVNRLASQG